MPLEPENGRILLDGYDIAKFELGSTTNRTVPQDSLLFDGSIRNIILIAQKPLRLQRQGRLCS